MTGDFCVTNFLNCVMWMKNILCAFRVKTLFQISLAYSGRQESDEYQATAGLA